MSDTERTLQDDEEKLNEYAATLADAVEASLESWVVAQVAKFWIEGPPDTIQQAAEEAGRAAVQDLAPKLRALLELDIEEQWTNPLAILRTAIDYPMAILRTAGVPPVQRDSTAEQFHPTDVYDITPGGFAAFGPEVGDAGLRWGAAKAHVHLRRRADERS